MARRAHRDDHLHRTLSERRLDRQKEHHTSEPSIDELGPVDHLVVEFPAGQATFNGQMAAELAELVESGSIRILDLMVLTKDADGMIEGGEIDEFDELRQLETEIAEVLAAEDVAHLAEAVDPGAVAGVIVWENRWAVG